MIISIALRELRNLFLSPLAWSILVVMQLLLTWLFLNRIDMFFALQAQLAVIENAPGATDLIVAPHFQTASNLMLMITPLLTSRLISEERRNGSLQLLLSSPVSMTDIVLGKYLGIVLFLLILVLQITLMPLSLLMGTSLDMGKVLSGMMGLMLLLTAFAAAGLYISSTTKNPTVAAVASFGLLIMFWIIDTAGNAAEQGGSLFSYLSIIKHNIPMLRGIVNSSDIIYYLLFISTFIILSIRQLDAIRLQK